MLKLWPRVEKQQLSFVAHSKEIHLPLKVSVRSYVMNSGKCPC